VQRLLEAVRATRPAGTTRRHRDKQSADSLGMDAMRRAALKKACDLIRKEAAEVLCRHLDAVAGSMSLEKSAAVRSVQRDIASGKPLAAAIKTAYPRLSGEQRGILAPTSWTGGQDAANPNPKRFFARGRAARPANHGGGNFLLCNRGRPYRCLTSRSAGAVAPA
jgi:hypothetical protein